MLVLAYAGLVVAVLRRGGGASRRVLVLLPFVAGFGNLVFFALLVGRSEHRFLLPFGFYLSAYGGIACDALLARVTAPRVRQALLGLFGMGFAWAGLESFAVHLTQLGDARRDVVRYLARLPPGSSVETYGLTVYQPHFDVSPGAPYRVRRVGPERPGARNPLVGAEEFQGIIGDAVSRHPDVIVLSEGFANAYFEKKARAGASTPGVVLARQRDRPTVEFVRAAVANELAGYRQVLVARSTIPTWATTLGLRPVRIQSTTGSTLWVLAREGVQSRAATTPSALRPTTAFR